MANKQQLPPKENASFKAILRYYETKQYKKGLKEAEKILKKFPEHGETLAMKGLTLNCLEKKTEAYEFVKKGLLHDINSHVCWHVYGLLYRSDRDYNEAIKCYRNALKRDADNHQILRDLSMLQVQTRDYKGFLETRRKLVVLKPSNRSNWIVFCMASQLAGDLRQALEIFNSYEATIEKVTKPEYENSEMLLYKNMLIEESGDIEGALNHLNSVESLILDKLYLREKRGAFLVQLRRFEEAEKQYWELININTENAPYHKGLQASRQLSIPADGKVSDEQQQKLLQLYEEIRAKYPRSRSAKRIPLNFLSGEAFAKHATEYIQAALRKGVPALFRDLKLLYQDQAKAKFIEDLLVSYVDNLKKTTTLTGAADAAKEEPNVLLWALYYIAQHFDKVGNRQLALTYIDEAIQHTPTLVDLYLAKARILKHNGESTAAAELVEKARTMDLADRYLNTKATKYFLRANNVEQAEKTIGIFAKEADNVANSLFEMQCMWYEYECGMAYFRLGEYGKALKKFTAIDKHFADFNEDQFDFHTYCIRKMTLRAYIRMLRFEDVMKSHPFFIRATSAIVKTYLTLYDNPKQETKPEEADVKSKGKKSAPKEEPKGKDKKAGQPVRPADPDPNGEALLKADPLPEASKYLSQLVQFSPNNLQSHLLAFDVFFRKKKYLLCVKALKQAARLAPQDPELHKNTVKLFATVQANPPADARVAQVLKLESEAILGSKSLAEFNRAYAEAPNAPQSHVQAAAEAQKFL